jgi:6-bladed beta-propeller protein
MTERPDMRVILTVGLVAVIAACGGKPGSGAAVTRDSAGIQIVENGGPVWKPGEGWKVVDSPLVDIGERGGETVYELDQVRGPVHLSDGRLALANATTNDVRFYDAKGKHLRSAGRPGSGPGEYQNIQSFWLGPGDSLLVVEPISRRLSLLDAQGNFVRSFSLGGQPGQIVPTNGRVEIAVPVGWFADGTIVGIAQSIAINQKRDGTYRDSISLIRYGSDGVVRDTLGRFPGAEMEQMTISIGPQTLSVPTAVPLGKQTVGTTVANRMALVQNNSWEIELRDADGRLRILARANEQPTKLTPSDIAAHRKEMLSVMEATPMFRGIPAALKSQITARAEQAKYPATLPFFSNLLADPEGNVWAQEAAAPTRKAQRFAVIDSTGRWLGTVTMPTDFTATSITADAVYGVWKDADEVEHVRGYRLLKP